VPAESLNIIFGKLVAALIIPPISLS